MNESQQQKLCLLAGRFDEWLAAINFSPLTRRSYYHKITDFIQWLIEDNAINSIGEVTPAHLQQYQIVIYNMKSNRHKRLSPATQRIRLNVVRKFFSWLVETGQLIYNSASAIQMPKLARKLLLVLTCAEVRRLIDSTPIAKPIDLRDRCILEIFYGTRMRCAELRDLTIYALDLNTKSIHIHQTKNNHSRMLPLVDSVVEIIKSYLSQARPRLVKPGSPDRLFLSSRSGQALWNEDIGRLVAKAARRAKISKPVTPHTLRHSCATHLLKGRADIRQIQKLLGHCFISSTEIYTRVEVSDLRAVLQRCHPREKHR